MNRKKSKAAAKSALKKHYLLLVLLCLIAAILGTEFSGSLGSFGSAAKLLTGQPLNTKSEKRVTVYDVLNRLESGSSEGGRLDAEALEEESGTQSTKLGGLELGRSRGVLAGVVNSISSGKIYLTLFAGIETIVGSQSAAVTVFTILALLATLFFYMLFVYCYAAVMARVTLESRVYEKVPAGTFFFLIQLRSWIRTAWSLLLTGICKLLISLTVIGAPIQHYGFSMVPYILAENPSIGARKALSLSWKMTKGHKWELFKVDLSFIGWHLLGILTIGILNIFFTNPYLSMVRAEYYASLRKQAKEKSLPGSDLLSDEYLFVPADAETLANTYGDILDLLKKPRLRLVYRHGFFRFLADQFGLVLTLNEHEKAYRKSQREQQLLEAERDEMEGKRYPMRLNPHPVSRNRRNLANMDYMRHYSLGSLILMCFFFMFVGWAWEVSLHLFKDGVFVNRGTMHGPWLPIYGFGCILILLILNRFRKKPVLEFVMAVVLCGVLEYAASYYLEVTHNGMKWWDYTGYFLNINGRVCAEGLSVFGIGGTAVVYFAAPLLDNQIERIPGKVVSALCLFLIAAFTGDLIYTRSHPNTGKGITDYPTGAQPDAVSAEEIETEEDLPDLALSAEN